MTAVFSAILAALKAIPIIDGWVQQFVSWYVEKQYQDMLKENQEAIKKAVLTNDQRPIENAIGSPLAGELSGIPGSSIVDGPPGR